MAQRTKWAAGKINAAHMYKEGEIGPATGSEPVGDSGSENCPKKIKYKSVQFLPLATWQLRS
jgi:hypothetical protein